MLDIVVVALDAVNQEPSSCALKLLTEFCCLFVIVTVNVDDVPFVSVFMLFVQEYWLSVLQTFVHAANVGVTNNDAIASAMTNMFLLFIY
jgi:Na+/H+ antiporter NhaA